MGNAQAPSKAALSTTKTKSWVVSEEGDTVMFRHDVVRGKRVVIVNGREVHRDRDVLDQSGTIEFTIRDRPAVLTITAFPGLSTYSLTVDGEEVPDVNSVPPADDVISVSISGTRIEDPQNEDPFAIFIVDSRRGQQAVQVERKFRDFDLLNARAYSAYSGSHLRSNLPSLPPKRLKLITDHTSDAFVEERKEQLDRYLKQLVQVPRMSRNYDLLQFLGMVESEDD